MGATWNGEKSALNKNVYPHGYKEKKGKKKRKKNRKQKIELQLILLKVY